MQGVKIKNNGSKRWMKMIKRKWHKQEHKLLGLLVFKFKRGEEGELSL